MPWFYIDDDMAFNRKIVAAGNAAVGLWARAGSWSRKEGTHGFVPTEIARSLGTAAQAAKLLAVPPSTDSGAGLWLKADGGYEFHEWHERYDPEKENDIRQKRSAAGRLGGFRSGESRRGKPRAEPFASPEEPNASAETQPNDTAEPKETLKQNRTPVLVPVLGSSQVSREGYESNARENEPPSKCFKHRLDPNPPPCGPCAGFRHEHDEWIARRKQRDSAARSAEVRAAADVRAQAIANCDLCDEDGYRGTTLCDHDPDLVDRAARGMAGVRAAMSRPVRDA